MISYSVLNDYHYDHKPWLLKGLDCLSLPAKRILGGRVIHAYGNLEASHPASYHQRITALVISILFLPIAVIIFTSLAIKLITCPCSWEQKKVKELFAKTTACSNQFAEKLSTHKYGEALQLVDSNPWLAQKDFYWEKISALESVEQSTKLLQKLPITTLDHFGKFRDLLTKKFEKMIDDPFYHCLSPTDVQNALTVMLKDVKLAPNYLLNELAQICQIFTHIPEDSEFSTGLLIDLADGIMSHLVKNTNFSRDMFDGYFFKIDSAEQELLGNAAKLAEIKNAAQLWRETASICANLLQEVYQKPVEDSSKLLSTFEKELFGKLKSSLNGNKLFKHSIDLLKNRLSLVLKVEKLVEIDWVKVKPAQEGGQKYCDHLHLETLKQIEQAIRQVHQKLATKKTQQ